jgi:protein-L-isoaspartate(D-aspartate) O-methyltransferase
MTKIFRSIQSTLIVIIFTAASISTMAQDNFKSQRAQMVAEISDTVSYTSQYINKKKLDEHVMAAMGRVPRHEFVDKGLHAYAYENRPLPIGGGQTISQPYIVALMTDLAEIDKDSIVLEIGTGSGYQSAILSELSKQVYTIEIIEELGLRAKQILQEQGYSNVNVRIGDGYAGWPSVAPFDAILVTAAPDTVPPALIEQLKPGGRMVIPVGPQGENQSLKLIEKTHTGEIKERDVLPVVFVPLTRDL